MIFILLTFLLDSYTWPTKKKGFHLKSQCSQQHCSSTKVSNRSAVRKQWSDVQKKAVLESVLKDGPPMSFSGPLMSLSGPPTSSPSGPSMNVCGPLVSNPSGPSVNLSGPLVSSPSGPSVNVSGPLMSSPSGPSMNCIWSSGEQSLWSVCNWSSD